MVISTQPKVLCNHPVVKRCFGISPSFQTVLSRFSIPPINIPSTYPPYPPIIYPIPASTDPLKQKSGGPTSFPRVTMSIPTCPFQILTSSPAQPPKPSRQWPNHPRCPKISSPRSKASVPHAHILKQGIACLTVSNLALTLRWSYPSMMRLASMSPGSGTESGLWTGMTSKVKYRMQLWRP